MKTYKLLVNGAFVRSESGRHLPVLDRDHRHVANVPRGSRKDVRDAVRAARGAAEPWASRTAYNRGQILYRLAEAIESRGAELAALSSGVRRTSSRAATAEVEAAVDATVHYAGWTDKLHAVLGSVNPIAGPFLGVSAPEPTGIIGVLAPDEPDVLGLVAAITPALCAGNVVVALVSERWPLAGLHLGEVLAVADLPAGVVNLISGVHAELIDPLVAHHDLDGVLDAKGDPSLSGQVARTGAETIKRVARLDTRAPASLAAITPFVEIKSVWHPIGT